MSGQLTYIAPTTRSKMTKARAAKIFLARNGVCWNCRHQIRDGEKWTVEHPDALALGGSDNDADLWPIHATKCVKEKNAKDAAAIAKRNRIVTAGYARPSLQPAPSGKGEGMTPMEQSERKGLVERIPELRKIAEAATPGPWTTTKPSDDPDSVFASGVIVAATAPRQGIYADPPGGSFPAADRTFIATFDPPTVLALLDLLSSDARPAPMAEEVTPRGEPQGDPQAIPLDKALAAIKQGLGETHWTPAAIYAVTAPITAHIDDLTRKVAEAEAARDGWRTTSAIAQQRADAAEAWMKRGRQAEFSLAALGYPWLPCPICGGTESCDDTVRERAVAALSRPQQTDAVLAEAMGLLRGADAVLNGVATGADEWPSAAAALTRWAVVVHAFLARPSPGPATETDRKDGWWVTPEWRANGGIDRDLWLSEARVGGVYKQPSGWHFYRSGNNNDSTQFATIEEAQAALVLAVRPKDTAPPSDAYPTTVSDFCEVATEALQRILDRCETPRFNSPHWEAHGEAIEDWLDPIRKEATAAQAALLASVRPKQEGV